MRENSHGLPSDQRVAIYGTAIAICVFLGPFGTYEDLILWDRIAFWALSICAVGWFMEFCINSAIASAQLQNLHYLIRVSIGTIVGGLPGTSAIVAMNKLYRPEHLVDLSYALLWAEVSIMAMLFTAMVWLVERSLAPTQGDDIADATEPTPSEELSQSTLNAQPPLSTPPLMERLPHRLRLAQLISMSMQDHYVEVTTTAGSEMVLMRLSDAMDLLGPVSGVQTHRSHWAAEAFAESLARDGRRFKLSLSDGRTLPVSTKFAQDVQEMLETKKGRSEPAL